MRGFQFRNFYVRDENCGMKVGTDSVILAATIQLENEPETILDIGAGSGLLSFFCCQRYSSAKVLSVEIDSNACLDLRYNIEQSKYQNRITLIHDDIFAHKFTSGFDLIISNPPYFTSDLLSNDKAKSIARHEVNFSLDSMSEKVNQLLNPLGIFHMIYPADRFNELRFEFAKRGLYISSLIRVKNSENHPVKRIIASFSRQFKSDIREETLNIRHHGDYSKQFQNLCSEFYLDKVFISNK